MEATYENNERSTAEQIAIGLGWFSIGLGLAELASPGIVARLIGISESDRSRSTLRFFGLREIASGVAILAQPSDPKWLWNRVSGDMLDLAAMGAADKTDGGRTAMGAAAVLGVTALDLYCASQLQAQSHSSSGDATPVRTTNVVTVNKPAEAVYHFWRNFQNLPRFMKHLEAVQVKDETHSHWIARAPFGRVVEWDAEIVADEPNRRIAWRSLPGADVDNQGEVRFEEGTAGRGTIVRVEVAYNPPAGAVGAMAAKLTGEEPGQQIYDDLRRFKQILETGEVIHSDASIHESMHPAQPAGQVPADLAIR